jgi:hypothetical protein
MPYFKNIARFYLKQSPGTAGPVFDLFHVYRYTHGDPDRVPVWWLEQLRKSLFDEEELSDLREQSGFPSYVMFEYPFPGDAHEIPVCIGFFACPEPRSPERLRTECLTFLAPFDGRFLRADQTRFIAHRRRAGP